MFRNNTQSFSLRSVLEKDKLNGTNYVDWIRNLRIVLRAEKKEEVLDTPLQKSLLMMHLLRKRLLTERLVTTTLK